MQQAAHAYKGAASNFNAAAVVRAAVELEQMARDNDLSRAAATLDVLEREPERVRRLRESAAWFRQALRDLGYQPLEGESAIVPIVVGDTALAIRLSQELYDRGVFVVGFGYPVVPEGAARLRVQLSAAHTSEHLQRAIDAFAVLRSSATGIASG